MLQSTLFGIVVALAAVCNAAPTPDKRSAEPLMEERDAQPDGPMWEAEGPWNNIPQEGEVHVDELIEQLKGIVNALPSSGGGGNAKRAPEAEAADNIPWDHSGPEGQTLPEGDTTVAEIVAKLDQLLGFAGANRGDEPWTNIPPEKRHSIKWAPWVPAVNGPQKRHTIHWAPWVPAVNGPQKRHTIHWAPWVPQGHP